MNAVAKDPAFHLLKSITALPLSSGEADSDFQLKKEEKGRRMKRSPVSIQAAGERDAIFVNRGHREDRKFWKPHAF